MSSTTNRVSYVGDGSSTVFSFPYQFFSPSDIQVYLYDSGSSIIQPQALNTNYSIAGGQNTNGIFPNGGNVIMASAVPTNFQIIAFRAPSPVQNFVLLQNGQINSLALVQQFDYLTALVQRLQDEVSRALILPDGLGKIGGVTFSQQLPASINLTGSAYQVLTINSGASGWTLSVVPGVGALIPVVQGGTGQAAALTPGGVIFAASPTTMAPGPAGTVGQTLISGGAGAPTWGSISIGSGSVSAGSIQGILGLYQGGTNTGSSYSYPVSSVIVASGSLDPQQFAGVAPGASGLPFVSNGLGAQPTFQAIPLTGSGISGILPIASGGTGQVSAGAAFQALSPTTNWGDIIYAGSGNVATKLSAGSSGLFLQTFGPNANPQWVATASGSSLTNPMTTLGDMITGGAAGVATRLAGVTSSSSAMLIQTGSGAASAQPVWKTISPPIFTVYSAVGSSVHTVATGALWLEIYAVGGGGGGSGSGNNNTAGAGTVGGVTMFGSSLIICSGGAGGPAPQAGGDQGGTGGGGTINLPAYGETIQGGEGGCNTTNALLALYLPGSMGGISPYFGGYGPGAPANTSGDAGVNGGGGGGGGTQNIASNSNGTGGGSGGFTHAFIPYPLASTYQVIVAQGGAFGSAGTNGFVGGVGGNGRIVVITHFQ